MKALQEIGLRPRRALRLLHPGDGALPRAARAAAARALLRAARRADRPARDPARRALLQPVPDRACAGLTVGEDCFLGDECLFDLAEAITLGRQVTLAERVLVLTHMNVGYADHPLQPHFPPIARPVRDRARRLRRRERHGAGRRARSAAAPSWPRAASSPRTCRRARWSPACPRAWCARSLDRAAARAARPP